KEKLGEINTRLKNLDTDYKKIKENKAYQKSLKVLEEDLKKEERLKEEAGKNQEHLEINKLIDRLNHEGICPVCGKSHEGMREKIPVGDLDLEKISQDLSDIKIKLEKTKAIYEKNLKDLTSDIKLEEIEKIIDDNKALIKSYEDLQAKNSKEVKSLTETLNELGKMGIDLKRAKENKEKSLEEISTKLKNLEEIKLSYFAG